MMVKRVVSGGQTGVDRAALDAAMALGLACGGWCPRGRRAEDGLIPSRYPLRETPGSAYPERTAWNVRDSDATLVLTVGKPRGGTALTIGLARKAGKPVLVVDLDAGVPGTAEVRAWLDREGVRTLNVAGPRENESPGTHALASRFLRATFAPAPV
jgi:predicted Rossmann fold nucleotide-binding protein DprA/Smf involved in DNA uptake